MVNSVHEDEVDCQRRLVYRSSQHIPGYRGATEGRRFLGGALGLIRILAYMHD